MVQNISTPELHENTPITYTLIVQTDRRTDRETSRNSVSNSYTVFPGSDDYKESAAIPSRLCTFDTSSSREKTWSAHVARCTRRAPCYKTRWDSVTTSFIRDDRDISLYNTSTCCRSRRSRWKMRFNSGNKSTSSARDVVAANDDDADAARRNETGDD